MGLFGKLLGLAVGYSAADVARWQTMFPDGVSRMDMQTLRIVPNVPILDAIRHVQNSHGWSADNSCEVIIGNIAEGNTFPTACGRYAYFDSAAMDRKKERKKQVREKGKGEP